MSVMLSKIDFDPQEIADKDEADLEREEAEQQKELKDFLDKEFDDDDDLFDGTFNLNQSHVYGENLSLNQRDGLQNDAGGYHDSNEHNLYYETDKFSRQVIDDPYGEVFFVNKRVPQPHMQQNVPNTQFDDFIDDNTTIPYRSIVHQPTNHPNIPSSQNDDAQLRILYQARGRKIEELQKRLELLDEETSKDKRILQHKLTLFTGERDGLKESNTQLQNLLQEHKRNITTLNGHLQHEQDENRHLSNQIDELGEKLQLSETTIDSLQQQIKQMSETESLSRARSQHESMLASLRKKHEEEIFSLKEKLDDMQQALAWKVEDNNRYREMLESNSMSSEIGMLRHRLTEEENKNVKLTYSLDKFEKNNVELKEQLRVFDSAVKKPSLFSSTPFHVETQFGGKDFHTPISRIEESYETPFSRKKDSSQFRKKDMIRNLEEQNNVVENVDENQKLLQDKASQPNDGIFSAHLPNNSCANCRNIHEALNMEVKQHSELKEQSKRDVDMLKSENAAVKSNMANMIKDLDKEKARANEKQEEIMTQFVDDVKQKVRADLLQQHEQEKQKFQVQIDELNGELLYTKDEYVKLCEEMKVIEDTIRKDVNDLKELEISEIKFKLEDDYKEKLTKKEMEITNKYIEHLDKEKEKWQVDSEQYLHDEIDKAITLAKIDWLKEFNEQKDVDLGKAVEQTKLEYEMKILTTDKDIESFKFEIQECEKKFRNENDAKRQRIEELTIQLEKENAKRETCELALKEKERDLQNLRIQITKLQREIQSLEDTNGLMHLVEDEVNSKNIFYEWHLKEEKWKMREEELSGIIENTRAQLKCALESNDHPPETTVPVKHPSVMVESKIQHILLNKEKLWSIKELSYKKEMEGLRKECNDLELKCEKLQKTNVDIERQQTSIQIRQVNEKNAFQKEIEELKDKLNRADKVFFDSKNEVAVQKAKIDGLEVDKFKLEKEMAERLRTLILDEKKKWEAESTILQTELLKVESERLKNNLLADLQVQNESSFEREMKSLKENHMMELRELKQGFRDKLERIAQMKKNWVKEEQDKRLKLEQSCQEEMQSRISNLQLNHEKYAKDQQNVWEKNMKCLQDEHSTLVTTLREELSMKSKAHDEEKRRLKQELASVRKEIATVTSEYEKRLRQLKDLSRQNEAQLIDNASNTILSPNVESNSKSGVLKRDDEIIEKMRQFYLETLHKINRDVSAHIASTKERAARDIREAVRREQRVLALKDKPNYRAKPENREVNLPKGDMTINHSSNEINKRSNPCNTLQNGDSPDTLITVRHLSNSSGKTDRITRRNPVSHIAHDANHAGHDSFPISRHSFEERRARTLAYIETPYQELSGLKSFPL